MFIQEATFIPDSRVSTYLYLISKLLSLFSETNGITVGKGLLAKNSGLKSRMKAFDY